MFKNVGKKGNPMSLSYQLSLCYNFIVLILKILKKHSNQNIKVVWMLFFFNTKIIYLVYLGLKGKMII